MATIKEIDVTTSKVHMEMTWSQNLEVSANSVWAKIGYSDLLANMNVTSITVINPKTGTSSLFWRRS
ncbi:MAG: hypothetical protein HKL80_06700 [Acidimicrobiales bacterium]|nr:hypothetical protein [Acidimicrobiales bacterium]